MTKSNTSLSLLKVSIIIFPFIFIGYSCTPKVQTTGAATATSETTMEPKTKTPEISEHKIPGTEVRWNMVMIPAGSFKMGSPDTETNREEDEGPMVDVKLDGFWMGTHEVSFDEYNVFREKELDIIPEGSDYDADAITRPSPPYEDPTFGMGGNGFPAVSMTQFAALKYCKWLSDKSGKFYRLPTEAEWEYACRAGTKTAFSYGDDIAQLDEHGWHFDNSNEKYHKIGSKKPNAWGLYDMHGNVSEWTLDQYDADFYKQLAAKGSAIENPWREPTSLYPRTVKGGSWDDSKEEHRSASRISSSPKWKERDPQIPKSFWWNTDSPFVGFRIVSPAVELSEAEKAAFWAKVFGD